VIHNGRAFDLKNQIADTASMASLHQTIQRLFEMLEQRGVDYVLVGGVALLTYVEGRNTQDIDLILAAPALEKLPEIAVTYRDVYFARGEFEGLQIDILLTQNPLFEWVRQKHITRRRFKEQELPVASVEGLLLLKLYALPSLYRQGSFARIGLYENDITTLLHAYPVDVEALQKELSRHLDKSDLHEVENILDEIQRRIERYQKGGSKSV
jgi:hypothetical protein